VSVARGKPILHQIARHPSDDDRYRAGRALGDERIAGGGHDDHGDRERDQLGGECRQPLYRAVRKPLFERQVPSLHVAIVRDALLKGRPQVRGHGRRGAPQEANARVGRPLP
jgi:hypothetical protein